MSNNNFFEIDFLNVQSSDSGDAIPIRISHNGQTDIHVVDGGFQDTGEHVVKHINDHYGSPSYIDRVIVSHPDGDHTGGLRSIIEEFEVGQLWMLRPWLYTDQLIHRFKNFTSVDNLRKELRETYKNIATLEDVATKRSIPIYAPFQGSTIGPFTVMAPTKSRYLDLIIASDRTPEPVEEEAKSLAVRIGEAARKAGKAALNIVKAAWGEERFSEEDTSAENDMSVIQYAELFGKRVLLTADAGRSALEEAADYAPSVGLELPGIDRFQVPHHGSRRNVSTEILDRWLGERLFDAPQPGQESCTAIVSASEKDEDHPRKAVVRACIHRGAKVITTEQNGIRTGHNAPPREGWVVAKPYPYPEDQED